MTAGGCLYGQIGVVPASCWRRGPVVINDRLSAPVPIKSVLERINICTGHSGPFQRSVIVLDANYSS